MNITKKASQAPGLPAGKHRPKLQEWNKDTKARGVFDDLKLNQIESEELLLRKRQLLKAAQGG